MGLYFLAEREIKKTVLFIITTKRKKYLEQNKFNQGGKNPYTEDYKTLLKKN